MQHLEFRKTDEENASRSRRAGIPPEKVSRHIDVPLRANGKQATPHFLCVLCVFRG